MVLHEPSEKRESVHARHFDIEREYVRSVGQNHVARHERIGSSADDFEIGLPGDRIAEYAPHQRRIVDDQHTNLLGRIRFRHPAYGTSTPWSSGENISPEIAIMI